MENNIKTMNGTKLHNDDNKHACKSDICTFLINQIYSYSKLIKKTKRFSFDFTLLTLNKPF